ncbi:hypothetical protein SAMN05216452_0171 [Nitratireductor aquibiodomus]|uniref:Uncharacterized protein n=1 Tax=Nitratireductor aquibiodomus TaxID=204799 RepID=A0A1H4ILR5_9HYPH|nr:hypothetical protein [Nitratireductor aquibiodomus]SEB34980.1 hypothetical protein SAMN05216452_0171 [Nitratireductor aquibiodomus]
MAIGRRRDFAALLDELISEDIEHAGGASASLNSLDYLSVAEELHSGRINFTDRRAQVEYGEHQTPEPAKPVEPEVMAAEPPPAPPLTTDPDEIARELGLGGTIEPRLLDRLRRDFAFRNHPDRVPAHLRANAMMRMQVANMLIDEAKRGRFRPRGSGEARA